MTKIIVQTGLIIILLLFAVALLSSSYTSKTLLEYNNMPKPVQLYWKEKLTFKYSVILKDGNGVLHRMGNMSDFANEIGEKYNINDTIK